MRNKFRLGLAGILTIFITVLGTSSVYATSSYNYVALGDSYAAGVGSTGSTGSCGRAPNNWEHQWVAEKAPGEAFTLTDVTCGGATTETVTSNQLPSVNASTNLVTVLVGGNNIGFATVLSTCTTGTDAQCDSAVSHASNIATTALGAKLTTLYEAAYANSGSSAKIFAVGYPRLFDASVVTCGGTNPLDQHKRISLNGLADTLNGVINSAWAAGQTAVHYTGAATTASTFNSSLWTSHALCDATPWINGVVSPTSGSYHPNDGGVTEYKTVVDTITNPYF